MKKLREKGLEPIFLNSGEATSVLSTEGYSGRSSGICLVIQLAGPSKKTLERESRLAELELIKYFNLTEKVSMFASQRGVPMVLISSISVYGSRLSGRVTESTPIQPSDIYGLSRFAAESAAREQFVGWPEGLKILRVSNAMGLYQGMPEHSKELLGNSMLIAAVSRRPFRFHGNPLQHRVFSSLRRVVDEIVKIGAQPSVYEPVTNVGAGRSVAISALYESLVASRDLTAENAHSEFEYINSLDRFGEHTGLSVFDELEEARRLLEHDEEL